MNEINSSNLFIGLITSAGESNQRVYNEWSYSSQQRRVPSFLLVEDTYPISQGILNSTINIIRFNRKNPHYAINIIKGRIETSRRNA